MIPNKTEEQILYQQFKYFDLDSSGFCTLQNFIRTNDRLGVVLPKFEYYELIFKYFADPETYFLNYRKFIQEIFNFKSTNEKTQSEKNEETPENDFITILTDKIIDRGGTFALIELVKNLQMADFEGNKRMNLDNFLKALQRSKIFLSTNEMQSLFNDFEILENGIVKYQIMINIILEQFWDDEKLSLSEQIYYLLTGNGRKIASLNVLKNYFDKILMDSLDKKFFIEFIDEYKTINKINVSQTMNLKELIYFLKFYNFGQKSNNYLIELINILKDEEKNNNIYQNSNINHKESEFKKLENKKKQAEREGKKINNFLGDGYENPKINEINSKLREKLIEFGRKTLFNFLKHFKFYDNKTNHISKYDFSKILRNFNIKLIVDDIDEIFKNYGIDKIKNSMNYELYLNDLILGFMPKYRQNAINYTYDSISEKGENFEREIDVQFLKEIYNARNNYFIKDEIENRIEFEECLDIFHYSFNGLKSHKVSKKEFCFFYYYISLLIPSDEDFFYMLSNEWQVSLDNLENFGNNKKQNKLDMLKISDKNINRNLSTMSRIAQLGEQVKEYQNNVNENENNNYYENEQSKKNKDNYNYDNINKNYEGEPKSEKEKALSLLTNILLKRGLRGILYLYSQFLSFCQDVNKITFNDFVLVFKIQHIDLEINAMKNIFSLFSLKNNNNGEEYLNFNSFIRTYKKELNDKKLDVVEQAFTIIDQKGEDKVPLDVIKMKYNAKNHPDVLNGKYTEDGKILEFLDCFTICYNILKMDSKAGENDECVDFEIFANFYEYVSFIYPKDKDFQYVVSSTWN